VGQIAAPFVGSPPSDRRVEAPVEMLRKELAPPARVIGKHIPWLHGRGVLLVQATVGMGEAMLIETSLSYLGSGVQEPTPSWGNMVALGKDYFFRGEL
jgi:peptide/nickel transport system permease protein